MMEMTPLTAFAPQATPPGPRMISMRSMSDTITSFKSQNTPENARLYTERPSMSTSNLLENGLLKPRIDTAHLLALTCAT